MKQSTISLNFLRSVTIKNHKHTYKITVSADAVFLAGDKVPSFCGVETTINTYLDIEAVTSKGDKEVWIFDVVSRCLRATVVV